MAKFLDDKGLARFWKNIKTYVDSHIGGSGGSASGEIYSTEETRIGTWIDGKPLYRIVVECALPSSSQTQYLGKSIPPNANIVRYDGIAEAKNGFKLAIYAHDYTYISFNGSDIYGATYLSDFINSKVTLVVEYTKSTD